MKLAVFDFDGTLLMKDTLPCLGKEWLRQKRSRVRYYRVLLSIIPTMFLYKSGIIDREAMKSRAFKRFNRIFIGMSRMAIEEFFLQAYPQLKKLFNKKILEEIKQARSQGFHCVLLSGAYIELLRIVAADLGIETVMGAMLAFKDGVFDPREETAFVDGLSKRSWLMTAFSDKGVDWEASKAFGDSYTDILILETVGQRIAVNPDLDLMGYARKKQWRIISD